MQYTLMHKNIAVADMELDEATSSIQRIDAVHGGSTAASPPAAPVCERHWKRWSCQIRRCC